MVEEDNCDEPKDIEIDYDDTAEAESAESSLQCLIKKCDVLLPNFTYEEWIHDLIEWFKT